MRAAFLRAGRGCAPATLLLALLAQAVCVSGLFVSAGAFAQESSSPASRLRVGLRAPEDQVRIGAQPADGAGEASFRLLDPASGAELWPGRAAGPVLVVPRGGRPPGPGRIYRVQAGAWRDEATARTRLAELAEHTALLGADVEVAPDPSRGVFRLRVGKAETADELREVLERLRAAGYRDAWIAAEPKPAPPAPGMGLRLVDARWETQDSGGSRVVAAPAPGALITVEGRPYRGTVEVLLTASGAVLAVNEVELEDYLRGVVPEELGPGLFPELEALKAQAVAARTYAVANLGQYAAEGYDICDTPRCQVYGGAASEHELSDRAVAETRGQILVFEDKPVNAMFTSTCGGHTEDVAVVFPEIEAPYLRGVPCRADDERTLRRLERVEGRVPDPDAIPGSYGEPDLFTLGTLVAHGIVPREAARRGWRDAPLDPGEFAAWTAALARAAGRPQPGALNGDPTRLNLWTWLAPVLGPPRDSGGTILPGDEDLVLQVADREAVPRPARFLVAGLLARGVIRAGADGRLAPGGVPSRGEALGWIARAAAFYEAAPLREGVYAGGGERELRIREKGSQREWAVARPSARPSARGEDDRAARDSTHRDDAREADDRAGAQTDLFFEAGEAWHITPALELFPGDRVVFVPDRRGEGLALLGLRERRGSADDRTSPKFRWVVAKDRATLEARLAPIAPVGQLRDLEVTLRGRSGRVAQMEIRGSSGTALVEGFRVSRALDLQETQFTVEVQRAPDGTLRRAVFSGRGWGHGVGLCQYGAYGMAVRGATAREILEHYYTGVRLKRLGS